MAQPFSAWIVEAARPHSGWSWTPTSDSPPVSERQSDSPTDPLLERTATRSCLKKIPGCDQISSEDSSQRTSKKSVQFAEPESLKRKGSLVDMLIAAHPEWAQDLVKAKGSDADIQRAASRTTRFCARLNRVEVC